MKNPLIKKIKFAVVAAYAKELLPLCDLKKKHVCVKNDVAFLAAGIGPVAASFGLTHFLKDYRPEVIIAIGTAGFFNDRQLSHKDIALVKQVSAISGLPDFYSPKIIKNIILKPTLKTTAFYKKLSNLKKVNVYSPQEITKSNAISKSLDLKGHEAENLEMYSLAFVAKKFKIPLIGLVGLTNKVGLTGHQEWKLNEEKTVKNLCQVVKKLIS